MPMDERHIDEALQLYAVSSNECTGPIPFAPVSEAELDAYQDLYDFEAKANGSRKRRPFGDPAENKRP